MGSGEHDRPDPEKEPDGTEKPSESPSAEEPGAPEGNEENWDSLVLDESFIREAEINEPAARTRMLRERWRDNPPEPEPWRADEPPAGWFFSKSRRKARKRRRRRDR